MRKLLVTGGAGFIGSHLVDYLLSPAFADVDKVVVLDALTYSGQRHNLAQVEDDCRFHLVHGDIMNSKICATILAEHNITAVLHLAAETHVDRSIDTPEPFFQTNVIGTLRLLDAFRKHHATSSGSAREQFRFLHISTDEVFGSLSLNDPPFCETTPYDPRSPYSASKAASDHLVRAYFHTYGLPILITNCSNNYGPRQFPEKLIPLMILNALEGKRLPVYGDGQQRRDWLHVADHCEAIGLVLRKGRIGETYTVGGQAERTNLELLQILIRHLDQLAPRPDGTSYSRLIQHVKDRPGHDRRYSIAINKISQELDWKPRETLFSGLEKTVRWYLDNLPWAQEITEKSYQRNRLGLAENKS